jgi:RhtB (resistance to homoserine/threonine) family protein
MAYLPLLLSLLLVDLLAAMSPGPNFVLVAQAAIHRSFRDAAAVVCGVTIANLIWCGAVVFGLSALFELSPWLHRTIQLIGGVYLIYLAVRLWRAQGSPPIAAGASAGSTRRAALVRGTLTNLSNPKSLAYFGSIFALFIGPETPRWVQAAACAIVIGDTLIWYGTVAALFSRKRVQRLYGAIQRPINRLAAAVMAGFGVRLIVVRD